MGHMTAPGVGKAMQDVRLMYAPISNYTCVCRCMFGYTSLSVCMSKWNLRVVDRLGNRLIYIAFSLLNYYGSLMALPESDW